jgi:alkylated DNA nucleotide flippase Atl1
VTARADRVLERIRRIPRGTVLSYGVIDPEAPRFVGAVLARTHADVPWHRVVHADGSIPKGERQRALLLREGVPMRGNRVDMDRARARRPR